MKFEYPTHPNHYLFIFTFTFEKSFQKRIRKGPTKITNLRRHVGYLLQTATFNNFRVDDIKTMMIVIWLIDEKAKNIKIYLFYLVSGRRILE